MRPEGAAGAEAARRTLTRTVWALGAVSLLTDLASDMIFPLLPAFLVGVLGASATSLGLIEGVAEGTSSVLKLVSGRISDRAARRKGLVVFGYGLSSLAKPLIALATAPWHVLAVRFADRVGKGLRSAPRDAMLAAESTPATRGRVFGLHRAMDTAGAMLGPVAALAVLALAPENYRLVFALAAVPALLSVVILVAFVRERPGAATSAPAALRPALRGLRGALGVPFWKVLAVVLVFTLGNSSDAFPLLRAQQLGVAPALLPLLWLAFNAVYAAVAWFGGRWSDRAGRRRVLVAGFVLYAACYAAFALAGSAWAAWAAFGLYGLYYGLTEGVLRALIGDVVPAALRGTAYGVYYAAVGVLALLASVLAGALWDHVTPAAPFWLGAATALLAALLAAAWLPSPRARP